MRGELQTTEISQLYSGQGYMLILFIALLIYFVIKILKTPKLTRNNDEIFIVAFGGIFTIIFLNPFFAQWLITTLPEMTEVYYRFYWCLPIPIVVATAFTQIILLAKTVLIRIVAIICVLLVLFFCGTPFFKSNNFFIPENSYKISTNLINVINVIHENSENKEPIVVLPTEYLNDARQYDPSIKMVYGRAMILWSDTVGDEDFKNSARLIFRAMNNEIGILSQDIINALKHTKAQYIVLPPNNQYATIIQEAGFEFVANVHEYLIYKIV